MMTNHDLAYKECKWSEPFGRAAHESILGILAHYVCLADISHMDDLYGRGTFTAYP